MQKASKKRSILLLSTKLLIDDEVLELKDKWKFKNIIFLSKYNLEKWKQTNSEKDISHFKKLIDNSLNEGDYILIHGDLKNMIKLNGYVSNPLKRIKIIYFTDKNSESNTFFKEL